MSITPTVLFESVLQNVRYNVVRENNVLFHYTIADSPLINESDLISTAKLMGDLNKSQISKNAMYIIGYGHITTFLDSYFAHLSLTNIDLSVPINIKSKVPKDLLKGKLIIEEYEDGEIIHKPLGVVF